MKNLMIMMIPLMSKKILIFLLLLREKLLVAVLGVVVKLEAWPKLPMSLLPT